MVVVVVVVVMVLHFNWAGVTTRALRVGRWKVELAEFVSRHLVLFLVGGSRSAGALHIVRM